MVAGAWERTEDPVEEASGLSRWWRHAVLAQQGRSFLWSPIALTFGIWIYFGLPVEPPVLATAVVFGLAVLLAWLGRGYSAVILVAVLVTGFALAKLRTELLTAPMLQATTAEVAITGTVESIDKSAAKRMTLILAPDTIEGVTPERVPRLLRLSVLGKFGTAQAGDRVALKARLQPLPSPIAPGGFDYGRRLWFDGIGGTGRVTAAISILATSADWRHQFERQMAALRHAMGARIEAQLDGTIAAFAEALITGERATIPKETNQSLMVSGLFHILSISGLHMWMVAGGVFWTLRAVLALSPRLAQRWPIKKWAAVAAVLTGWFYMLLADSGVATERSFIMIAVVFFAVLVDRPAVSTRNLAIAALIVLLRNPEAAIDASFQMSFLAVLGLVAFYEIWSQRENDEDRRRPRHWTIRLLGLGARSVFLALVTTAVAGSISSIPAAYHFGRMAPYGLIANGLAFPVVGIVIMPMALAAAMLMPFGLEALPLYLMGEGLKLLLAISDWVAGFPGATLIVAQPPAVAMVLLAGGATALCLLRGPIRLAGLPVAAIGLALAISGQRGPDLLVETYAGNVALRNETGQLVPARARKARFAVEKWLQSNGETATPADAAARPGWACTETRCDATVQGKRVAYVMGDGKAAITCEGIDILVAEFPLRRACRAVATRIDRFDVWRGGAHAITIVNGETRLTTARGGQWARPWTVTPEARKEKYKPR